MKMSESFVKGGGGVTILVYKKSKCHTMALFYEHYNYDIKSCRSVVTKELSNKSVNDKRRTMSNSEMKVFLFQNSNTLAVSYCTF